MSDVLPGMQGYETNPCSVGCIFRNNVGPGWGNLLILRLVVRSVRQG